MNVTCIRHGGDCSDCADCVREEFTDRERFLVLLNTGPMLRGDAIVVLCGEDAEQRANLALGLFLDGGAPTILLSGGKHEPPRWKDASAIRGYLLGKGVAPDRIVLETASQNTREQAVAVVRMACDAGWKRIIIVASSYHSPRAYLTFLKTLHEVGHDRAIHILSIPATQSPWFAPCPGMTQSRADLLAGEVAKIAEYQAQGHVASYADGIAAIRYWENGT